MLGEPPVIDKKETRKRVERILDNYRSYLLPVTGRYAAKDNRRIQHSAARYYQRFPLIH